MLQSEHRAGMPLQQSHNYPFSKIAWWLIAAFCAVFLNHFRNWGQTGHPFVMDVDQYYSYLHAAFIDHDLSFSVRSHPYWFTETPTLHFVPKVTYGMSLLYAPFFLLAHLFAGAGTTGYEPIYAWSIHIGCMLYGAAGLWYCRKTLLLWFSEGVTAATLLLLFFGTNLFYYLLSETEAVHIMLFCLIAVYVYHVAMWQISGLKKHFLVFMFTGGIMVLVRPTECLLFLLPALAGVTSADTLKAKLQAIGGLKWWFPVGVLLFILPVIPQLLFWKMQSGSFLFFSYGSSEKFYWSDPQLFNFFFSFRKGWLIYTPLMLFGLMGFIPMYRYCKAWFYPVLAYVLLNIYVSASWWDWAYGGSFGMRVMVHVYAVLAIPFACMVQWVYELYQRSRAASKITLYGLSCVAGLLCLFNVFQSNLYKHHIIHWDSMTAEAYRFVFLKRTYSEADKRYLESLLRHPDYQAMREGKRNE